MYYSGAQGKSGYQSGISNTRGALALLVTPGNTNLHHFGFWN